MKGILAVTAGICVLLLATLLAFSVSLAVVGSILAIILVASGTMIFFIWWSGLDVAKVEFKTYVIPVSFFLPRKLEKGNARLAKYFISDTRPNEKKILAFFTLFLGTWGFATALMVGVVEVIRVLGLDSPAFQIEPIIKLTPEPLFNMPSPLTIEGFLVIAFLLGIPFACRAIIPDCILRSVAIRRIRDHNIVQSVPYRNLNMISGLWGIASFAILFFTGVLNGGYDAYVWMAYSLMFAIIIGIPICIMSLFYTYEIEPRIQPKLVKYLTEDLGIEVTSLEDMISKSRGSVGEKQRAIACLGMHVPHNS